MAALTSSLPILSIYLNFWNSIGIFNTILLKALCVSIPTTRPGSTNFNDPFANASWRSSTAKYLYIHTKPTWHIFFCCFVSFDYTETNSSEVLNLLDDKHLIVTLWNASCWLGGRDRPCATTWLVPELLQEQWLVNLCRVMLCCTDWLFLSF